MATEIMDVDWRLALSVVVLMGGLIWNAATAQSKIEQLDSSRSDTAKIILLLQDEIESNRGADLKRERSYREENIKRGYEIKELHKLNSDMLKLLEKSFKDK